MAAKARAEIEKVSEVLFINSLQNREREMDMEERHRRGCVVIFVRDRYCAWDIDVIWKGDGHGVEAQARTISDGL